MAEKHRTAEFAPSDSAETITIIGATTRAAAQSARRAFYRPVTADLFADLDLRAIAAATQIEDYPGDFARVLAGSQSGHWLYTGALENYPDSIERWQSVRPLLGNTADVLRRVRDPLLVAECLRRAQLPCPRVFLHDDQLPCKGTWLRKPLRSAAGMNIMPWLGDSAASDDGSFYYQEQIFGESVAAAFLAADGNATLVGVTRQLLGDNSFRYAGSIGPLPLSDIERLKWTTLGEILVREFQLVGLFGIDAIRSEEEIWPVEINPRYTASMELLEAASGQSFIGLHVAACREHQLPKSLTTYDGQTYGKQICFAGRPLNIDIDLRSQFQGIADVPQLNSMIAPGDPVMTFLRSGKGVADTAQQLRAAVEEFRQLQFRQAVAP